MACRLTNRAARAAIPPSIQSAMTSGAMARCASASVREVTWYSTSVPFWNGLVDLTFDGGDVSIAMVELEPAVCPPLAPE